MDKSNVVEFAGRDGNCRFDDGVVEDGSGAADLPGGGGRIAGAIGPPYGATSVRWPGWSGS